MSRCVTPAARSASMIAFMVVGRAPTVPASPTPLTPSWLRGEGTSTVSIVTSRAEVGARHRVVHEAAAQHLSVVAVDAEFTEYLPQPLEQPAPRSGPSTRVWFITTPQSSIDT